MQFFILLAQEEQVLGPAELLGQVLGLAFMKKQVDLRMPAHKGGLRPWKNRNWSWWGSRTGPGSWSALAGRPRLSGQTAGCLLRDAGHKGAGTPPPGSGELGGCFFQTASCRPIFLRQRYAWKPYFGWYTAHRLSGKNSGCRPGIRRLGFCLTRSSPFSLLFALGKIIWLFPFLSKAKKHTSKKWKHVSSVYSAEK